MVLSPDARERESYARALQAQHSLRQADLFQICAIAQAENVSVSIEAFTFEQCLGFASHLFVTAQAQHSREQLAQVLSRFGSQAVLPLLKVAHHFDPEQLKPRHGDQLASTSTSQLAINSLKAMPKETLVMGYFGIMS